MENLSHSAATAIVAVIEPPPLADTEQDEPPSHGLGTEWLLAELPLARIEAWADQALEVYQPHKRSDTDLYALAYKLHEIWTLDLNQKDQRTENYMPIDDISETTLFGEFLTDVSRAAGPKVGLPVAASGWRRIVQVVRQVKKQPPASNS